MTTLKEFRAKFPQYNDMTDADLVQSLHDKYYKDMPIDQFHGQIEYDPSATPTTPTPDPSQRVAPPPSLSVAGDDAAYYADDPRDLPEGFRLKPPTGRGGKM